MESIFTNAFGNVRKLYRVAFILLTVLDLAFLLLSVLMVFASMTPGDDMNASDQRGLLLSTLFITLVTLGFIFVTIIFAKRSSKSYILSHLHKYISVYGTNEDPQQLYERFCNMTSDQCRFIIQKGKIGNGTFVLFLREFLIFFYNKNLSIIKIPNILWVYRTEPIKPDATSLYSVTIYTRCSAGGRNKYLWFTRSQKDYDTIMHVLFQIPLPVVYIDEQGVQQNIDPQFFGKKKLKEFEAECDRKFSSYYEKVRENYRQYSL